MRRGETGKEMKTVMGVLASQFLVWVTRGQSHRETLEDGGEHASEFYPQGTRKVEDLFTNSPTTVALELLPETLTVQHSELALPVSPMCSNNNKKGSQEQSHWNPWVKSECQGTCVEHQQSDAGSCFSLELLEQFWILSTGLSTLQVAGWEELCFDFLL